MFELKKYQKRSIAELENYLITIKEFQHADKFEKAFTSVTEPDPDTGYVKKYKEHDFQCPFVCIKIPTGGGKTIVACHMLHSLFEKFLERKEEQGLVIWLVPTDAIRSQTIDALKNRDHPYREVLDHHFSNNIKILNFKEALKIKKSDIEDNLCILVATVSAFRITDKDGRKAYSDSGDLLEHFTNVNAEFLDKHEEGDLKNSLMNVIKLANPIIVVDEGHNVKTTLSIEMLKNMNPSFILEYTATPKPESNILVNVTTAELKEEKMVKIPIFLSNIAQWEQTIQDGVDKRKELEEIADNELGEYIRPIALLQAQQEKEHPKRIYVQKIKDFLIDVCKIPEEQIAIKTGTQDQIYGLNLFSKFSPIRYIITVSALKEGWDNAFAYVLISVANLGARIAVEQTIGRIMRLPNAKEKRQKELNVSYVFTCSKNFKEAASNLEKGLLANGYTPDDWQQLSDKIEIGNKFKRSFDGEIKVPYISMKKDKRKIRFYDLIGENFDISKQAVMSSFDIDDDQNRILKIDVDKKDNLKKSFQTKLNLIMPLKDFSKDDLLNLLDKKIVRHEYSQSEKRDYLKHTIDSILNSKTADLTELSVNFYKLRDEIIDRIDKTVFDISKSKFDELEKNDVFSTDEIFHEFPDEIEMDAFEDGVGFKLHLYEKAGTMNTEELDLVQLIDNAADTVDWWFRSREMKDFYIQGWQRNKVYPDFIVKTKSGNYLIVEYKGAHLLGTPDTLYKKELGKRWAEMAGKNYHFFMVGKTDITSFMNDLKKL